MVMQVELNQGKGHNYIIHASCNLYIREYGSTLYVGMTRVKNGGRIKRVH